MKILELSGLDRDGCEPQYQKVLAAIGRDDFRTAEVKKLVNLRHGKFYRAKLDYATRLLFAVVRHGESVYALMLEIIRNHAYEKSRFLRGATVDEANLTPVDAGDAAQDAEPVRYIHPSRAEVHLLDKVISFDDAQEAVYGMRAPLIIVGSAGSGKTALTLEKLKQTQGDVLYVTHSAYLAQSARDLYYAQGFEIESQQADFFSFRELLESVRVPQGREALWGDFSAWYARMQQQYKNIDPHQAFEEIRGVITASADGVLTREAYRELGVRQSIFPAAMRDRVYALYEKYHAWLEEKRYYDLNLIAHAWMPAVEPRFDFVVIDEVQDFTNAQLGLVLKALKKPGQFLLCGDSNQIVHPNFFSWSKVKSLFWNDADLAANEPLQVLRANFRNSPQATAVANTLLKIKHARFGSIDRESNFLVDAVAGESGSVTVLDDKERVKKDLNQKTKTSAQFAVLVMRDDDKAPAKVFFQTPLVFSIHEAKGLEYDNIILYRFVSGNRHAFNHIADGVQPHDLTAEEIAYRRAKDKADKSLEVYKFYINALYVALTRAVRNVYLIESDTSHPLLQLLGLKPAGDQVQVEAKSSSIDDWQKEAHRLELQGKQEQADAIRQTLLQQTPVPWPVLGGGRLRELIHKVFHEPAAAAKFKQQLYEYALSYNEPQLAKALHNYTSFAQAINFDKQRLTLGYKHLMPYYKSNNKDVLALCDRHGIDHRTTMNLTPLMGAAVAGNVTLVETLLERGADQQQVDHLGRSALHWAMLEAFRDAKYAKGPFADIYEMVAPSYVDVQSGGRLRRIGRHIGEYLLFQTLWALFKFRFDNHRLGVRCAFNTGTVLHAWHHLPAAVVKPERNKRSYLNHLLSRNEINRDYAYNRCLFYRIATGRYFFDPGLAVRRTGAGGDTWASIYTALNLPLVKAFSTRTNWDLLDNLSQSIPVEFQGDVEDAEQPTEMFSFS